MKQSTSAQTEPKRLDALLNSRLLIAEQLRSCLDELPKATRSLAMTQAQSLMGISEAIGFLQGKATLAKSVTAHLEREAL